MWNESVSLPTLGSGEADLVRRNRRGRASAARALSALVAVLLLFGGLTAPAQAQVGAPPPVDNLRCVGETDRIVFLWESAEWPGGETASYEYWLTMPDGSESSGGWGKWFSRTSAMMLPGSYSPGDRARLRLVANYRTPAGREVTGAQASLSCYVGGANELVITPTNTTRVYGEADALGYTVSGLVDGDTAASVVTGSVSRTPGGDAGRYDIGLGTLAIASDYAGKYVLPDGPVGTYVITPKSATYTATGADKHYDATTKAPTSLGGSFAAGDILAGDVVTVTGGTYSSADAGTGLAVAGSTVGGADAGNYSVTASVSGDITPRAVTAISGVRVSPRLPDGTTTATFDTSAARATGVVASQLADFRAGGLAVSGTFPSAEPGSHEVSVTYSLQNHRGFKTGNYTLSSSTGTLHGEIQSEPQNSLPQRSSGCEPSSGDDYDADDDGLIDVCNLAQLSAIRYDLGGDGSASGSTIDGAAAGYEAAFPGIAANGPGCPQSGCKGYELTADLDFDTNANGKADSGDTYWDNGKGWLPIGEYTAVFDGNGSTISNLYFKSKGLRYPKVGERRGLFDELGETGVIRDVMLVDVKVDGNGHSVGALVGKNLGAISNAGASGTVSGWYMIGGLVANNQGTITDSHSSGEVSAGYGHTGGLVGMNAGGRIVRSWSTADVSQAASTAYETWQTASTTRRAFGGLVGLNYYKRIDGHKGPVAGSIAASYATGRVTTRAERTGGLVGRNDNGEIFASYATGDVTGTSRVGGLVGSNFGPVSASYALGTVSGTSRVGGLLGSNGTDSWNSFVPYATHRCVGCNLPNARPGQVDPSGITASYGHARGNAHQDRARTAAQLRRPTGYSSIYARWDDLRDDRGDSYAWDFGTSLDFPVLRDTGPSVAAQRAQMPNPADSAAPPNTPAKRPPPGKIDYDTDDDGLIEVRNLAQLNAISWDMTGSGTHGWANFEKINAARNVYKHAYPSSMVGMGCPKNLCIGYELMNDLDFDTNGNGKTDPGDHYYNGVHLPDDSAHCIDWYKWHPVQAVRDTPGACDDYWGNDGEGWRPLSHHSTAPNSWYGIFEGNGHAIRNLYINTLDTPFTQAVLNRVDIYGYPTRAGDGFHNYRGLFEVIARQGVVRNLRLENVDVSGKDAVGALAGINRGTISNVHVTGSVSGISRVGGLVGYASERYDGTGSFITGSSSRANVAGRKAGGKDVGGLVGVNEGVIRASYARGAVSGSADNTGGLVGRNAEGDVCADRGCNTLGGSITASYASGPVSSAGRYTGGLVGDNVGDITASYATGSGLVGRQRGGTVTAAYWDTQASGQTASAAGAGKTTAQLQSPVSYTGIYAGWNADLDGDSVGDNPWDFGTAGQYPVLRYGSLSPQQQRAPFTAQALSLPRITDAPPPAPNKAPTVSGSLDNVTLAGGGGTKQVSLSGLFDDGDGDSLTVTANALTITAVPPPSHDGASYIEVVEVSVSSDYSALTLTGRAAGTATVTVTANDGNGGTVSTALAATVTAPPVIAERRQQVQPNRAPTVANPIADVSLDAGATSDISLSNVFSDPDGDALRFSADSADDAIADAVAVGDTLRVTAVSEGTATITVTAHDADGNRVSDSFEVTVAAVESVLSGIAARFDADNDGTIDGAEYQRVKNAWFAGEITQIQFLALVRLHLKSR